ncbi:MAG: S8 family serine peptidase, partial [Planctomycetota bacterium]
MSRGARMRDLRTTFRAGAVAGVIIAAASSNGWAIADNVDLRANAGQQAAPAFLPDQVGGYSTTHILVKVRPGVDASYTDNALLSISPEVDAELAKWNVLSARPALLHTPKFVDVAREIGLDRWHRIDVPQGTDTLGMAEALNEFADVIEVAEVDLIGGIAGIPNDPDFDLQYALHNTGQTIQGQAGVVDADIDAVEAWDTWTGDGSITLAVIDSGVDPHPDYNDRLVPGWNTYNNGPDTSDACPHGTHVAGIAGAAGNDGAGVAGVSWGVNIMPIRVLLGCNGNSSQCADGITWSVDNGANIGTMSLQYGYTFSQYFEDSTTYAHANNVLLVAAAANFNGPITYPAKFPLVMSVAATDNRDEKAWFSCFGPEQDCAAPGVDVYNTWINNSFAYLSGTSMAAPHVSGLASLIWSADPSMTNDEVRNIINSSADDLGAPGWDKIFG